ncbi:MAG: GNAT family N-acetyltransferase [Actinomycetota bacterium]
MTDVRVLTDRDVAPAVLAHIRAFVTDAFPPGEFSADDWDHCEGGWRAIAFDGDVPVAHAAVVPRPLTIGTREFRSGYVEGVATHPRRQREGLGALVINEVNGVVRTHFEIGALSTGVGEFYARLGWEQWRGASYVRNGAALVRTEDEDDGLMVLRFGPSEDIDLAATITCDCRAGDDW